MKRLMTLTFVMVMAGSFLAACGDEGQKCGPGTVKQGGDCVPACADGQYWDSTAGACMDAPACGTGTSFNATTGNCEPDINECAAGTHLNADTGKCEPDIADCGPGTTFNEDTGRCEPECGEDQYWTGTECAAVPECADGTTFNPDTGACEADITECAPGTHLENGVCLPNVECGPGTHPEGGQCVANYLPNPDVPDNEQMIPEFALPDVGEENAISLGGTIGEPTDLDGDGMADPDYDYFLFQTASGGVYLNLWATSEGAALPTFAIMGIDPDTFGQDPAEWEIFYSRYGIEPNGMDVNREVYLPRDGVYLIEVTDYNHMVNDLFGNTGYIPVGGPDFTYYMTVEQLAAPTPTVLDLSAPAIDSGNFGDGQLKFYSADLLTGDFTGVMSAGLPLVDMPSDLFPALLVFGPDGSWLASTEAYNPVEDVDALIGAQSDGEYIIVQDFLLLIGPNREFRMEAWIQPVTDATGQTQVDDSVGAGEYDLLQWDLLEGDMMVAGIYPGGQADLYATLLNADMEVLADSNFGTGGASESVFYYTDMDQTVYLWVREVNGEAADYSVEAALIATPLLEGGNSYTGLEVADMPADTLPDAGVEHFMATAGQIFFFSNFTPDGSFTTPIEQIYTPMLDYVGPAVDPAASDYTLAPFFFFAPTDGHFLHLVWDGDNTTGLEGATYDVDVYAQDAGTDLGTPAVGQDVGSAGESLDATSGFASFVASGDMNLAMEITVTPAAGTTVRPEVWALSFGVLECVWSCYWIPDPTAMRVGLMASATATADGEAVTLKYLSPYGGTTILMVADAGGNAGADDTFDIDITVPDPPANDTCATAEAITLTDGAGTVDGTTFGASNSVDLGDYEESCTGYLTAGPDVFYTVDLTGDTVYNIELDSTYDAALYLITDCGDPGGSCAAGADANFEPGVESVFFKAPADGTYIVVVDGYSGGGDFTLNVSTVDFPELTVDGGWVAGEIQAGEADAWYAFSGTEGTTYYVWWDDSWSGSGSYSLDLKVSAYQQDMSTGYFVGVDSGYSTPQAVTIAAGEDTVYVRIAPYYAGDSGTFGVAVTTTDTQP